MKTAKNTRINIVIGQKFNMLTVVGEGEKFYQPSGQSQRGVVCKCECGKTKRIRLSHIRTGRVQSCGCLNELHGYVGTGLHNSWRAMKNRCKPNYFQKEYYHDKGISYVKEWKRFVIFKDWAIKNGYHSGLQIDRVDNSKGYSPDNCRWVTQEKNLANRSVTVMVTYKGKEVPIVEIVREKGLDLHASVIRTRIKRGWSHDDAIDTPIKQGKYKRVNW